VLDWRGPPIVVLPWFGLVSGRPPRLENEQEVSAFEFTRQLAYRHRVEAETYA
jgi:hypothetical protein